MSQYSTGSDFFEKMFIVWDEKVNISVSKHSFTQPLYLVYVRFNYFDNFY